jgi:hypothetical protein
MTGYLVIRLALGLVILRRQAEARAQGLGAAPDPIRVP